MKCYPREVILFFTVKCKHNSCSQIIQKTTLVLAKSMEKKFSQHSSWLSEACLFKMQSMTVYPTLFSQQIKYSCSTLLSIVLGVVRELYMPAMQQHESYIAIDIPINVPSACAAHTLERKNTCLHVYLMLTEQFHTSSQTIQIHYAQMTALRKSDFFFVFFFKCALLSSLVLNL